MLRAIVFVVLVSRLWALPLLFAAPIALSFALMLIGAQCSPKKGHPSAVTPSRQPAKTALYDPHGAFPRPRPAHRHP